MKQIQRVISKYRKAASYSFNIGDTREAVHTFLEFLTGRRDGGRVQQRHSSELSRVIPGLPDGSVKIFGWPIHVGRDTIGLEFRAGTDSIGAIWNLEEFLVMASEIDSSGHTRIVKPVKVG